MADTKKGITQPLFFDCSTEVGRSTMSDGKSTQKKVQKNFLKMWALIG